MKGERRPDLLQDKEGWSPQQSEVKGGDYWKLTFQDGTIEWFCCPPAAGPDYNPNPIGGLGLHDVVENDDGTITVSPSILMPDHYHGYLVNGEWTSTP